MVSLTPNGKEKLDHMVAKIVEDKNLPGFVFGATTADKEIYFNAGGYKVLNNPKSGLVGPDSIFWLCSQTKLIAHVAALQLIDRGNLSLEDLVSDYIPEFANTVIVSDPMVENPTFKPAKIAMRVKHLLNFTSGLFYILGTGDPTQLSGPYSSPHSQENSVSGFLSLIKGNLPGIPLLFEPGTNWAYGWNSDILGFIVEKVAGQSLEQYLQENVFRPLDIEASFYLTPDIKEKLVDLSYRRDGNLEASAQQTEEVLIERDPTKVKLHFGGAGLYSSLQGYLNLLRHLLQVKAGKAENAILSANAVESLFDSALNENGVNSLTMMLSAVDPNAPKDLIQWSTGLAVTSTDWTGRRKKGTGFWGGWANLNFFIDPTSGVAAVFATQLVPAFDRDVLRYYAELETALYAGIVNGD